MQLFTNRHISTSKKTGISLTVYLSFEHYKYMRVSAVQNLQLNIMFVIYRIEFTNRQSNIKLLNLCKLMCRDIFNGC